MGVEGSSLIRLEGISKSYTIWNTPQARLQHPLMNALGKAFPFSKLGIENPKNKARDLFHEFWALRDVSFSIARGESVGIIGKNGSGKSTLLQIIAGTLQPTSGSVEVQGRVAALLELGSGFNPEFTGRENVYFNASILGLSQEETANQFERIVEFADIGEFLDQPVKTYSSGMLLRLAFAVQVVVEPDLLIVDEALGVGDVFFQQKCFTRIRELQQKGTSVLIVSHDTAAIQNLCQRVILLREGVVHFDGKPEEGVSRYYGANTIAEEAPVLGEKVQSKIGQWKELIDHLDQYNVLSPCSKQHGPMDLKISKLTVCDSCRNNIRDFPVNGVMHVILEVRAKCRVESASVGLHLFDRMNNLIFAAGTRQLRYDFADFDPGEIRIIEFKVDLSVSPGQYTFSVGCSQATNDPNVGFIQHRVEGLGPINVLPPIDGTWDFYGFAKLPMTIIVYK